MDDKISSYRIDIWPAQSMIAPPLDIWPVRMGADGIIEVWGAFSEQPPRTVEVPNEFLLGTLLPLDLNDPDAVAAFVKTWGTIQAPHLWKVLHAAQGWREKTTRDADELRGREETLGRLEAEHNVGLMEDVFSGLRKAVAQGDQTAAEAGLKLGAVSLRLSCHVDRFRWSAQLLKDMLRTWLAMQGELPFSDVIDEWESPVRPKRLREWPDPGEATRVLTAGLDQGLRSIRAKARLVTPAGSTDEAAQGEVTEPPDLYAILCLQLASQIAKDARYHRCENPACGKWFVRGNGGPEQGQHRRRAVKYCSRSCAMAVARRRYRRSKRGAGNEGSS